MNNSILITNARLVLPDRVEHGALLVKDGVITRVGETGPAPRVLNLEGDFLLPGLVEIHTDHLETQFIPRPGILWPSPMAALLAHDLQIIGSGITTVLNGICCGQMNEGKMRHKLLSLSIGAIKKAREQDLLKADHLLHLRCEVCDPEVMDMFTPYVDESILRLVSIMDHTPGQRQFTSYAKYREYYNSIQWTDGEFEKFVNLQRDRQEEYAPRFRAMILALCKERGLPVASHDDTQPEHVREALQEGISISEFPTTDQAAAAARELGLAIVLGSPNVIRNGSHSGNVSARELADKGLLDVLSSDYVPTSLLHAAFVLHEDKGIPLPEAVAKVTKNPADILGLADRGRLEQGTQADLVRVAVVDRHPIVKAVWRQGIRMV